MNAKSHRLLGEVHEELAMLMIAASKDSPIHFEITEGLRSRERQIKLYKSGATKTFNSRHLDGHAVDVACYVDSEVCWSWPLYEALSVHIKTTAEELGIPIEWGGDWKSFRDGVHYQLPRSAYPSAVYAKREVIV